jgi:hypothetical protein
MGCHTGLSLRWGVSLNSGRYDPAESGAVLTRGKFDYVILITYGLSDTSQRTSPKER